MDFFIGSYTKNGGPGVGKVKLENNKLSLIKNDPLPNSTFVIYNKARTRLFAICSDPVKETEGGSAASYDITDGQLKLLSRQDTLGAGPCHLMLDPTERFLYTANYHTGSISVFPVDENGLLGERIQLVQHEGHSVHPTRQIGPHCHQVTLVPGDKTLLCCIDLGIDALMVYEINEQTGLLSFYSRTDIPAGHGPRHLIYAKNGMTYLACEVGNRAMTLKWNGKKFDILQDFTTLPEGYTEKSTVAAIRLTSDEKRLLVSNRGHDSIALFSIDEKGLIAPQAITKTGDLFPRDFDLVDDNTLLIGHQDGCLTLNHLEGNDISTLDSLDINGCVCVAL